MEQTQPNNSQTQNDNPTPSTEQIGATTVSAAKLKEQGIVVEKPVVVPKTQPSKPTVG